MSVLTAARRADEEKQDEYEKKLEKALVPILQPILKELCAITNDLDQSDVKAGQSLLNTIIDHLNDVKPGVAQMTATELKRSK